MWFLLFSFLSHFILSSLRESNRSEIQNRLKYFFSSYRLTLFHMLPALPPPLPLSSAYQDTLSSTLPTCLVYFTTHLRPGSSLRPLSYIFVAESIECIIYHHQPFFVYILLSLIHS